MKEGLDLYLSKNMLFWIYECDGDYYLLNLLPVPISVLLGQYRSMIFKIKGRKLSQQEYEKYKSGRLANKKVYYPVCIGLFCWISTKIDIFLSKTSVQISFEFLIVFILAFLIIWITFLSLYRRKGNMHLLEYNDIQIRISTRGKGLLNWIKYNLIYMISIGYWILIPDILQEAFENGCVGLVELRTVYSCIVLIMFFSIFPFFPALASIAMKKD